MSQVDADRMVRASLSEAKEGLQRLVSNDAAISAIVRAAETIIKCLDSGGKVLSCGNGGSMSDAMHFAEELSGRYREDRPAFAAIALSDPAFLTCVANDYGYESVFSRGVEALGQVDDVLVCLSTSGASQNIVAAAQTAKKRGMSVIALTGRAECPLDAIADIHVCTPAGKYADRVQELHIKVIHIMIEIVESSLS